MYLGVSLNISGLARSLLASVTYNWLPKLNLQMLYPARSSFPRL
ncbi:MAG: hypothetical protein ACRC62_02310 [Microcoleus sp.]